MFWKSVEQKRNKAREKTLGKEHSKKIIPEIELGLLI